MTTPPTNPEDREAQELAQYRYGLLHIVRIFALGAVIGGIAIANAVLPAPYWFGVVLAVSGMIAFFFAPPLLAKRWKAGDPGER